jgi:hypothetical protein
VVASSLQVTGTVPFKMGIDARLHYDKGGKVTELMLEYLDMTGMRGIMSVAKFEGTDSVELITKHFVDSPTWGKSIITQIAEVMVRGIEMSVPDGETERHLQVRMLECHDLVGWHAVMGTAGPLSNHPCPFCKVSILLFPLNAFRKSVD